MKQSENLRRLIKRMEERLGPDAPILKDLRVQLSSTERAERGLNESAPNPITLNEERYVVGMK